MKLHWRSPALVLAALIWTVLTTGTLIGGAVATEWPKTDIPPDPAVRQGVLANGMRYAILKNGTPAGAVSVRFSVAVGSTHEEKDQRGFSHFVEHMAFRGSKNFPDGELNRTLERLGLRFGADTNASTGQDMTSFMFTCPTPKAWVRRWPLPATLPAMSASTRRRWKTRRGW